MDERILREIRQRGLFLEKDIFDLLEGFGNTELALEFLKRLDEGTGQKMITKNVLSKNFSFVNGFVENLDEGKRVMVERTFVNLGMSLEIKKERHVVETKDSSEREVSGELPYRVFYADTKPDKKLEVRDFVGNFRARYQELQGILMDRPEIKGNLMSINKISKDRQSLSIIGIVVEKRVTKNKNLIIKLEDLTGEISGIVKADNEELFEKAGELQPDDIIGVKASGNRDLLFIHDLFFPDSFKEKVRFEEDIGVAFISDIHCGSDRHLGRSMERFLDWLEEGSEEARKIRYLFIVGDNVDGVGIFPGQENVLKLKTMGEQYKLLASYLKRVPKWITMFMCPGQHDSVRVAEPQPVIGKKYAPELHEIENLVLVTNPTMVKLIEKDGRIEREFKILMYHGASIHSFISEIGRLRLMKAHRTPAKAVVEMLRRRHLSPTHGSITGIYIPNAEKDLLVISEVPDILCTGEVHRLDIENYHGSLIITGSCWQAQTPFEEKVGNIPDPGKVPVFNLKSGEVKILDFLDEEEVKEVIAAGGRS